MKILFLANHFITLYSFRKELINKLIENGHKVYLSLPESDDNKYFTDLGCKVINTKIDRRGVNPIKDLKLKNFYSKIMKEIKPNIIFSYTIKPNIYGALASNGKYKQICNITGTGATFLKNGLISNIVKYLYRISIAKSYKVFFQNRGDQKFFIDNKLVKNNYELIPGSGCNIEEYKFSELVEHDIIRFMYIGRVMKLKGIDEYLIAAKYIKNKYPNTEFIIAGWNEEVEYKKILKEYGNSGIISYIGFQNDIKKYLKDIDCVILPSHGGEGIPNVILEASAMGRAVIGSNINGTNDVILDELNGYLFKVNDANSLIEKIEKFINLPFKKKKQLGINGRKIVEKNFDRKFVIDKYLKEVNNC